MKKILSIGLLTACALAVTEHQASAWVNAKFSVGLNWHLQSANNNVFWGMWKNGQVPGPEAFGGGGPGGPIPFGQNPPGGQFPYFGNAPQGAPGGFESAPPPTAFNMQQPPQQQQAFSGPMAQQQQPVYFGQNPYQAVSYQPNSYFPNYFTPNYYPTYNQGYGYQAPYYWYQGR